MTRSAFSYPFIILVFAVSWILSSCTATPASLADKENYSDNDDQYRKSYTVTFDPGEKPLRYGYYYIVSQVEDGYRVRVFHPEKKTITEDKTYSTPALTLLHGSYNSWWDDGSIREQGIYQYGRKHSVWVESEPGKGKSVSGEYLNNRKEGLWTQLDSNGMIESVHTYVDGKLHGKFYLYDAAGQKINEGLYGADTLISELIKQPVITLPYLKSCIDYVEDKNECTEATLAHYISENLKYPSTARKMELHGIAYAQWDVMPSGQVQNIRIPSSLSNEIGTEALKVIRNMPDWMPARQDGEPMKWTMSVPLNFKL